MKVFISYGHRDSQEFAEKLAEWLKDQGYEPWLDKKGGIVAGDSFDVRIEKGISKCGLVIALLSPSSIRYDSFCRNEWLYAQSIAKPIIPVRLSNITPPLLIINLHYEDAFPDPNQVFAALLPVINEVLGQGKSLYREWINKTGNLSWWANRQKISFKEELKTYGESFVGRTWVFDQLIDWVASDDSKLALIIADTGWGKSAISAHLATRLNVRSLHFCTSSNSITCEPVEWLKELIFQLASQFNDYRIEIERRFEEPNWELPPETLLRLLIIDPLNEIDIKTEINDPWIFVIDSLDESLAVAGPAMTDLLSWSVSILPAWIKIIATSRPEESIISKFSNNWVKQFCMHSSTQKNQTDLNRYVELRLSQLKGIVQEGSWQALVNKIVEKAEGNFQYTKILIDSIGDFHNIGKGNFINNLEEFPVNLVGLYNRIFRMRFTDITQYKDTILPVINCLIAAREPLDENFLIKASGIEEKLACDAILLLSQFLNRTESGVRFFHQSIIEWLVELKKSTVFSASKSKGENLLADVCWDEYKSGIQSMSEYSSKFIAIHLAETNRWNQLHKVVSNSEIGFIKIWTEGGQGNIGITCLKGLINYLLIQKNHKNEAAGFATQLARIYSLRGEFDNAKKYLILAFRKTSLIHGRRIKAVAMNELASLSFYERDLYNSKKNYKKALFISKWGGKILYDEAASSLIGLATIAWDSYQIKRAFKLARRAKANAIKVKDFYHLIAAERLIGAIHKRIDNIEKASFHLSNALNMCDLMNIRRERYRILLLQGWLELDIAASSNTISKNARPLFEKAYEGAKYSMDHYFTIEALLSIGWTYLKENNTKSARHYLHLAENELMHDTNPELKIATEAWQFCLHYLHEEYKQAMDLGIGLINKYEKLNIRIWHYSILILLGSIKWHQQNAVEADKFWADALEIANSISGRRMNRAKQGIEMCKKDPCWLPL
jgi:tetratricopeptide (TPR) repeat protein